MRAIPNCLNCTYNLREAPLLNDHHQEKQVQDLCRNFAVNKEMGSALKSLWASLKAFLGFWIAFVCATICNTLLPCDILKANSLFQYFVTDAMVNLRLKIINLVYYGGPTSLFEAAIVMFQNATLNFLSYFKEIFVIVTFLQFTPLLGGGLELHFMIPRWCRPILARFGYYPSRVEGEDDEYYHDVDDEGLGSPSEPPPLEDMSHLLASGSQSDLRPGSEKEIQLPPRSDESSRDFHSAATTPIQETTPTSQNGKTESVRGSISSHDRDSIPSQGEPLSRQNSFNPNGRQKERYVYDSVYGVILQETRDLWQAQEGNSQHRKQALLDALASSEKSIPPVRFSTNKSDVVS